ncbi:hypothetical protein ENU1_011130 [Entamoeba nuttalli P19]|uniref:Uncharacterized protein n=1 Tax=Entamoeba nuttalli (strain P19) TaxID=1076696 RepID=K2I1U1_ENTNP|nr:hypothetical protein ENU1_011130 [Entamoeba nuttalli P19]EKE42760.1 hypothetical protein ENU1_011130 [Entamoeba nuttalli P19]|eukprot:XP_008854902.1 hypothetical protein ENU1_011130 [Entamoeba nuttalli P19]
MKNHSLKCTEFIHIEQSHHLNQNNVKENHLIEDVEHSNSSSTIPTTTIINLINNDKIMPKETDDSIKIITFNDNVTNTTNLINNESDNSDDFLNEIIDYFFLFNVESIYVLFIQLSPA